MRLFALAVLLCLASCASPPPPQQQPAAEVLPQCPAGEFRGLGAGETEKDALGAAYSELAKQISSSIRVSEESISSQETSNGKENLNTHFKSTILQESVLHNANDARIVYSKNGNAVACMSRADAAKPYILMQGPLLDSLKFFYVMELNASHPKLKSEARGKANMAWAKILANYWTLKSFGMNSDISMAKDLHDALEDDYKDYCQTARLHWVSEQATLYSEIVFSKLSGSVKMEKSACAGRGIMLAYKGSEPECSMKFGINTCSYSHSLTVSSCEGTEYLQLKNEVMGAHQKPEFALEKLQGNLGLAEFWHNWIKEIEQWSSQCD